MLSKRQKTERRAAQPAQAAGAPGGAPGQGQKHMPCASFLLSLFHVDHDVTLLRRQFLAGFRRAEPEPAACPAPHPPLPPAVAQAVAPQAGGGEVGGGASRGNPIDLETGGGRSLRGGTRQDAAGAAC
eukprot:scaffold115719_cov55-Phaeocystis_antarctica.AAC.1